MKKFISLVLALVMALSLTTVAWGADVTYTYDDTKTPEENYTLLKNAIEGAADGDTVYVDAGIYTGNVQINIAEKSLTVIGVGDVLVRATDTGSQRKAFYITGKDDGSAVMNVVMKNIDIEDVNPQKASIWVRENVNVTFEDVNCASIFVDNGYNQNNTVNLNVVDCDVDKLSLEASVDNATNLDYDANSDLGIRVPWAGHNDRTNISVNDVTLTEGDVFTAEELQAALADPDVDTIVLNFDAGEIDVPQGVTIVPNGYDVAVEAPAGSEVVMNTAGEFVVVPAATGSTTAALYDLYTATVPAVEVAGDAAYATVAAVKNEDGSGSLEYVKMDGKLFVKIPANKATINDFYVTAANQKVAQFYLKQIDSAADVTYAFTAVNFTNLGVKCDQMNAAYLDYTANEVGFYLHTSALGVKTYYADGAVTTGAPYYNNAVLATTATNILVGTEIVEAYAFTSNPLNQHVWAPSGYDKTTPVSALCGICGAKANLYTAAKTPASSVIVAVLPVGGTNYNVVMTSAGSYAPVVTPSTDKVQSAETFDAGIAMYVGMSVMAAAGSAVVLKKKD